MPSTALLEGFALARKQYVLRDSGNLVVGAQKMVCPYARAARTLLARRARARGEHGTTRARDTTRETTEIDEQEGKNSGKVALRGRSVADF